MQHEWSELEKQQSEDHLISSIWNAIPLCCSCSGNVRIHIFMRTTLFKHEQHQGKPAIMVNRWKPQCLYEDEPHTMPRWLQLWSDTVQRLYLWRMWLRRMWLRQVWLQQMWLRQLLLYDHSVLSSAFYVYNYKRRSIEIIRRYDIMDSAILCMLAPLLCRRTVSVGRLQDFCISFRMFRKHSRQEIAHGVVERLQCIVSSVHVASGSLHAVPRNRKEASGNSSAGSRCSLYPSRLKYLRMSTSPRSALGGK